MLLENKARLSYLKCIKKAAHFGAALKLFIVDYPLVDPPPE